MTTTQAASLAHVKDLAECAAALDAAREAVHSKIEALLAQPIRGWEKVERVPCGHTGGWELDRVDVDQVHLIHECYYAHSYDLHVTHTTVVDLARLLESAT